MEVTQLQKPGQHRTSLASMDTLLINIIIRAPGLVFKIIMLTLKLLSFLLIAFGYSCKLPKPLKLFHVVTFAFITWFQLLGQFRMIMGVGFQVRASSLRELSCLKTIDIIILFYYVDFYYLLFIVIIITHSYGVKPFYPCDN